MREALHSPSQGTHQQNICNNAALAEPSFWRVLVHIPDKGHVTTRYYDWYANRPRGMGG